MSSSRNFSWHSQLMASAISKASPRLRKAKSTLRSDARSALVVGAVSVILRKPVAGSRVNVSSFFCPIISRLRVVQTSHGMYRNRLLSYIAMHIVMSVSLTSSSGVMVMPTSRFVTSFRLVSISAALSLRGASPSDPSAATPKVTMSVNGVDHRIISLNPLGGALQLQFILQSTLPSGSLPVAISIEGISTALFNLAVRTQN